MGQDHYSNCTCTTPTPAEPRRDGNVWGTETGLVTPTPTETEPSLSRLGRRGGRFRETYVDLFLMSSWSYSTSPTPGKEGKYVPVRYFSSLSSVGPGIRF